MATFCLRELAPDRPAAAQALLEASRDDDAHVRRAALTAMAGLLDPPAPVVARLDEALDDADASTAGLAALALGELGAKGALPRLRALAASARTPALQQAAQVVLTHGGPAMKRNVIVTGGTGGLGGAVVAPSSRAATASWCRGSSRRARAHAQHFADALRAQQLVLVEADVAEADGRAASRRRRAMSRCW